MSDPSPSHAATPDEIFEDMRKLAARDPRMAPALAPGLSAPVRRRTPGFLTLIDLILEQQVSVASARAMSAKLRAALPSPTPAGLLALNDETLKACGFSRQKVRYARSLADAVEKGTFTVEAVAQMPDQEALEALVSLKGIGVWTAECYLLLALGRRDIMPAGDLALQIGWQELAGQADRPSATALREAADAWAPMRTAAAIMIWRAYLSRRGRPTSEA